VQIEHPVPVAKGENPRISFTPRIRESAFASASEAGAWEVYRLPPAPRATCHPAGFPV
jgi:hypothetical protein